MPATVWRLATRRVKKPVRTMHYVDADGERILVKNEQVLRVLVDQNLSMNFSLIVNMQRTKKGGSSIKKRGSRTLKKALSSLGGQ